MHPMRTYRLQFTLRSPSGSLWQADTLFGHLCWLLVWRHGEARLKDWLQRYYNPNQTPPLILSDGFPGDRLPRPLGLPPMVPAADHADQIRETINRKRLKDLDWISPKQFERIRRGELFDLAAETPGPSVPEPDVTFCNQISRLTGTTGDEGQLYPVVFHPWQIVTVYVRVDPNEFETVKQLFDDLATTGFGANKSVGYGEIAGYTGMEKKEQEFSGFAPVEGANAFVSLSHFVPAQHDPTDGAWNVRVKYGKLGGEWANSPNPFKHPLLMLTPGSWFRVSDPGQEWYGRMVTNISPDHSDAVQYGLAFAVPIRLISSTIEWLTQQIQSKPQDEQLYLERARAYLAEHLYTDALRDFTTRIALNPYNANAYRERGVFYYERQNYDAAISDYTKAIELNPDDIKAYQVRGDSYKALLDYHEAIKDYTKVIEIEPKNQQACLEREDCYFKTEQYAEALEDWLNVFKALKKPPDGLPKQRGDDYRELECYEEAIQIYDKLIEKEPNAQLYFHRGECYHNIGNYREALEDYNRALVLESEPKDKEQLISLINDVQMRIPEWERNRILVDVSHRIKNYISTVIGPLQEMRQDHGNININTVDDALIAANLIQDIVQEINSSFNGTIQDFRDDAQQPGMDKSDMRTILLDALKFSINNIIVSGRYFDYFLKRYFPTKKIYDKAVSCWNTLSRSQDLAQLTSFLQAYFFEPQIILGGAEDFFIGNAKNSKTKFLNLFQEIIFNAVKFSASLKKEHRFVRVYFSYTSEEISIKVENRFNKELHEKTSGLGHISIENLTKQLQTKPIISCPDDIYSIEIRFKNLWI